MAKRKTVIEIEPEPIESDEIDAPEIDEPTAVPGAPFVLPKDFRVPDTTTAALSVPAFVKKGFMPFDALPPIPDDRDVTIRLRRCFELCRVCQPLLHHPRLDPQLRKRIKEIQKLTFSLQQTADPIADVYQKSAESRHIQVHKGEARRAAENAMIQAAIDHAFDGIPISPEREIAPALISYVVTDGLAVAQKLRAAVAGYQIELNNNFALLSPNLRHDERKVALHSNPTPDVVAGIVAEENLVGPKGPTDPSRTFKILAAKKRGELGEWWRTKILPLEIELIDGALKFTNACREAAIGAEQDLWESAEMTHDGAAQTAVSRRFDLVIAELQHHRKRLANCSGGPLAAACEGSVLGSVFGVTLL